MRKIREVLRLRHAHGLSQRAIGASLRVSTGAVNMCLSRARRAGLSWPIPSELDDVELERLLYPPPPAIPADQRPVPDWAVVHLELRRPNVTLALLWEGHCACSSPLSAGEKMLTRWRSLCARILCRSRGPTL
jgi:hypothetical protein